MKNYQEVMKTTVSGILALLNLALGLISLVFLTLPLAIATWLGRVAMYGTLILLGYIMGLLMFFTDTLHLKDQPSTDKLLPATTSYEENDPFKEIEEDVVEMPAPTPRVVAESMMQEEQTTDSSQALVTTDVEKGQCSPIQAATVEQQQQEQKEQEQKEEEQGTPIQAATVEQQQEQKEEMKEEEQKEEEQGTTIQAATPRVVVEPIIQEEQKIESIQPTVATDVEKDIKKEHGHGRGGSLTATRATTEGRRVPVKEMAAPLSPRGRRKKDRGPIAGPVHKLTKEVKRAFTARV